MSAFAPLVEVKRTSIVHALIGSCPQSRHPRTLSCAFRAMSRELCVRAESLGRSLDHIDVASHVTLQIRHVEFRGHLIPVAAPLDVAALDELVQPLQDIVARAAD